jgi:hypothetical protein
MMRVISGLLLALALWRCWIDWRATIGEGYAYRLKSIGTVAEASFPETYRDLTALASKLSFWDPVGVTILSLPLALVLLAAAGMVWLLRRRRKQGF